MPCEEAMITKVITLDPDQTVEEALATLEKKNIRAAPVLDGSGKLLGMFSFHHLLTNLLPVSVTMDDGLQNLDFVIGAAPGVSKRLRKLKPQKIGEIMDRKVIVLHPHTPIWEGIRLLVKYGSPLPVISEEDGRFLGILTEQSAVHELEKSIDVLEEEVRRELDKKGKK